VITIVKLVLLLESEMLNIQSYLRGIFRFHSITCDNCKFSSVARGFLGFRP